VGTTEGDSVKRYKLPSGWHIDGVGLVDGETDSDGWLRVRRSGGATVLFSPGVATEVPPPIPDEPEPGAYLIGGVLVVRVSPRRGRCWLLVEGEVFHEETFAELWPRLGGPDISIVPLVPKVDPPAVTLPWSDEARGIYVRRAVGCGCAGETDGDALVDVVIGDNDRRLSTDEAVTLATAILTAAGHKAITEADRG
jgi:hypothetical protein